MRSTFFADHVGMKMKKTNCGINNGFVDMNALTYGKLSHMVKNCNIEQVWIILND